MRKKILLVEDEAQLVDMLRSRLGASGYNVIAAYDGSEGLEKARKEKPDLILLDIIMPKMNGYEVCKCLKEDKNTEDIPIIILTASDAKELEDKCSALGVNNHVKKPFEAVNLLAEIKRLIEGVQK